MIGCKIIVIPIAVMMSSSAGAPPGGEGDVTVYARMKNLPADLMQFLYLYTKKRVNKRYVWKSNVIARQVPCPLHLNT